MPRGFVGDGAGVAAVLSSTFAKGVPPVELLNPNTKTNRNCVTSSTVFTPKQIYVRRLHQKEQSFSSSNFIINSSRHAHF